MSQTVGEIGLGLNINRQGFNNQLNGIARGAQKSVMGAFGGLGKMIGVALGVKAVASFGKSCLDLGSNLSEVQNVVDVTFGAMAEDVNKFASTAIEQFGLSETSAKKYVGTMGAMLKSSGLATAKAKEMATTLTGLGADISSFYNISSEDAFTKLRAGMAGEIMPLRELGINMTVATLEAYAMSQGIGKAYEKMSQSEQMLLRYNYLLSVTGDVQGDFARTSNSWANQTRILTEQFNALKASLGQGLIAAFTPIVKGLNVIVAKLRVAAGYFKAFMELIFGKQATSSGGGAGAMQEVADSTGGIADSAGSASDAIGGVGDAAKKAGKKAKGALASFDELNQLNISEDGNSGSGGGAGSGGAGTGELGGAVEVDFGQVDTSTNEIADKIKTMIDGIIAEFNRLKDIFKTGFEIGIGGDWEERLNNLMSFFPRIKEALSNIFDEDVRNAFGSMLDAWALSAGQVVGAFTSIGLTIATNILGGITLYLEQNGQFIKDRFISIFKVSGEISTIIGEFATVIADILKVFESPTAQQITANIIGMFANGFLGAIDLALQFGRDLLDTITAPFIENKDLIKTTLEGMLIPIETITGSLKQTVDDTFSSLQTAYKTYIAPTFENIKMGLSSLAENILANYNTYIAPVIDGLATKFAELMQGPIQGFVDAVINNMGKIIENGSILWKDTLEPMIEGLNNALAPAIGFIVEKLGEFAAVLIEKLVGGATTVVEKLGSISDWCVENQGVISDIVAVIGAWAAAWLLCEGALVVANVATAAWGVISGVAATATTAFGTAIAFLTSPITLVVGAIAAVIAAVVLLIKHWDDVEKAATKCWDWIVAKWNAAGDWFNTTVIEPVVKYFTQLWEEIQFKAEFAWTFIQGIWAVVSNWFNETIIQPITNFFSSMWDGIKETASGCWEGVSSTWNTASSWFDTNVASPISTNFGEKWDKIKEANAILWEEIKNVWNTAAKWWDTTVIDPVSKAFSGMWKGIETVCGSTWTSIKNMVRSGINGIIDCINNMINGINRNLKFELPEILGGAEIGFSIPNVPRLARGGIVDQPTLAMVGEAGKEAVIPLENNKGGIQEIAALIANMMLPMMGGGGSNNDNRDVVVQLDGVELVRALLPTLLKESKRQGVSFP